jgi:hypothetical protein
MSVEKIKDLHALGSLSSFEFLDLLEKRWIALDKKIRSCTCGDSTWNEFHLWKSERHDIDSILEKI